MGEDTATVMAMAMAIGTIMAILITMAILMDIPTNILTDTPPVLMGEIPMEEIIMGVIIMNQGIDPVINGEIKG